MVDRVYLWTEDGLTDARHHKVTLDEVDHALHAPPGMRFERRIGDVLIIVMGMAATGRVIAVLCDHMRLTSTYRILKVRALAGMELDEWRRMNL